MMLLKRDSREMLCEEADPIKQAEAAIQWQLLWAR
jgi:hypothetical protein